ncbi:hypothetical protein CSV80_00660 [Sporosarcina sp. P12(2017)]|uniref:helix-turn-helix domain-containing protein n=1 Tax=unclassified Sporosarcina TaxID=2647733 RepID=UPI000C16339B|nr:MULTISPECIES: helix-turn-helix transcriptional regulator [unclassified Sporosarcina]PIC59067.1 hypothetical protein CSV81_00660 [Sporosarcina sp. P10]PIC62388.1 hypothetical protein CSV80_00660 [Sporosarcina sp. P12(2017)]
MLSHNLKKLRTTQTNLTQSEFAKKIDVARTTYAMYEQGHREPDYKTLQRIADYYNVSIDSLLGRSNRGFTTQQILSHRITKARQSKKMSARDISNKLCIDIELYKKYEQELAIPDSKTLRRISDITDTSLEYLSGLTDNPEKEIVKVAGQEINLTVEELQLFNELKKHPVMFHDLASDPEKKVKELLKMYKMKKMFLEDDEELGDGFGDLED